MRKTRLRLGIAYVVYAAVLTALYIGTIQFSAYTRARTIHKGDEAGAEKMLSMAPWTEYERQQILSVVSPAPSYGSAAVSLYDVAVGLGAAGILLLVAAMTYGICRLRAPDGFYDYTPPDESLTDRLFHSEQIRDAMNK